MPNYGVVIGDGMEYERTHFLLPIMGMPSVLYCTDCWVEIGKPDGLILAVHTHLGGEYIIKCKPIVRALRTHSAYIRDDVLAANENYITFYFWVPPRDAPTFMGMAREPIDLKHHWDAETADQETSGGKE